MGLRLWRPHDPLHRVHRHRHASPSKDEAMTAPKPLSEWQEGLPQTLPRHIRRSIVEGDAGCWLWTLSRSSDGYGWASLNNRTHQAHRLIYRLICGAPPEGKVLDHLCRVRHCVNPAHLEPVTPRENLARSEQTPAGMKFCKLGHELSHNGHQRRCLICRVKYDESRRSERLQYGRAYRESRRAGA